MSEGAVHANASVGKAEGLDSLAGDFAYNADLQRKIRELRATYGGWRRSRGDGNCYYRALGFLLVERLLEESLRAGVGSRSKQLTMASLIVLLGRLQPVEVQPVVSGRPPLPCTFDARERAANTALIAALQRMLEQSQAADLGAGDEARAWLRAEVLQPAFDGGEVDLPLVRALRAVAAAYLQQNASCRSPSDLSWEEMVAQCGSPYASVADFNTQVVESMGTEAEGVVLMALPLALGVCTRIVLLDRNPTVPLYHDDYGLQAEDESGSDAATTQRLHLLFKPGHYDMLYAHSPTAETAAGEVAPTAAEEAAVPPPRLPNAEPLGAPLGAAAPICQGAGAHRHDRVHGRVRPRGV
jgi:ubiquitin thioesterase protein OTUB1